MSLGTWAKAFLLLTVLAAPVASHRMSRPSLDRRPSPAVMASPRMIIGRLPSASPGQFGSTASRHRRIVAAAHSARRPYLSDDDHFSDADSDTDSDDLLQRGRCLQCVPCWQTLRYAHGDDESDVEHGPETEDVIDVEHGLETEDAIDAMTGLSHTTLMRDTSDPRIIFLQRTAFRAAAMRGDITLVRGMLGCSNACAANVDSVDTRVDADVYVNMGINGGPPRSLSRPRAITAYHIDIALQSALAERRRWIHYRRRLSRVNPPSALVERFSARDTELEPEDSPVDIADACIEDLDAVLCVLDEAVDE